MASCHHSGDGPSRSTSQASRRFGQLRRDFPGQGDLIRGRRSGPRNEIWRPPTGSHGPSKVVPHPGHPIAIVIAAGIGGMRVGQVGFARARALTPESVDLIEAGAQGHWRSDREGRCRPVRPETPVRSELSRSCAPRHRSATLSRQRSRSTVNPACTQVRDAGSTRRYWFCRNARAERASRPSDVASSRLGSG